MERYREQSRPYMNKNNYSQNKQHQEGINRLLNEFNNVLCSHSKNKNYKLLRDVVNALTELSENTHIEIMNDVIDSMGIHSLDPIFATS